METRIRLLRHIIVGNGAHARHYRAGEIVPAPMAEAIEWCLKRWALPVHGAGVSDAEPRLKALAAGVGAGASALEDRSLLECLRCDPQPSSSYPHSHSSWPLAGVQSLLPKPPDRPRFRTSTA